MLSAMSFKDAILLGDVASIIGLIILVLISVVWLRRVGPMTRLDGKIRVNGVPTKSLPAWVIGAFLPAICLFVWLGFAVLARDTVRGEHEISSGTFAIIRVASVVWAIVIHSFYLASRRS